MIKSLLSASALALIAGAASAADGPLVTTEWLEANLDNPSIALIEVSVNPGVFERGHIPGATNLSWHTDLVDPVWRDIASREQLEGLLREAGVNEDSTVILYCDTNTWFAAWGAWVLDGAVPPPSDPNLKQALAHLKGPAMARSSVTEEDVSASLTEHSKRIR